MKPAIIFGGHCIGNNNAFGLTFIKSPGVPTLVICSSSVWCNIKVSPDDRIAGFHCQVIRNKFELSDLDLVRGRQFTRSFGFGHIIGRNNRSGTYRCGASQNISSGCQFHLLELSNHHGCVIFVCLENLQSGLKKRLHFSIFNVRDESVFDQVIDGLVVGKFV